MTNIPSDEECARADARMEERFRGVDSVCEIVKDHFKWICPLYNVRMLPQGEASFRTYVFFLNDKDIEECKRRGIVQKIIDSVYEELERAGRGDRKDLTVAFEFDSDENVSRSYEGNYMLRLR